MKIQLCVVGLLAMTVGAAPPADIAADLVMLEGGQVIETMKFYASGTRTRLESQLAGGLVNIVRRDRGVVWTLVPGKRQYTEKTLEANLAMQDPASDPPGLISKQRTGSSVVAGQPCTTYRLTIAGPRGRNMQATSCYSEALALGLRMDVMGVVSELRNLRLGAQPAHLFEIPSGYQAMAGLVASAVPLPGNLPPGVAERLTQQLSKRATGSRRSSASTGKLPAWLPAMAGCTVEASGTEEMGVASLFCQSEPLAIADWYQATLGRSGFTLRRTASTEGPAPVVSLRALRGAVDLALTASRNSRGQNQAQLTWGPRR
ncbi:hypothetical protein [Paludibaculum fermentans]|uniref:hypothetical protein n=1 Tax=Paludibaculum fermentans TaxID=1473598 RepID=UPI003EBE8964